MRGLQVISKRLVRNMSTATTTTTKPVVNSHNEFDPLVTLNSSFLYFTLFFFQEEVIVGRVDGATIPEWHVSGKAVWPSGHWDMYKTQAGKPFPAYLMTEGKNTSYCYYDIYSLLF